MLQTYAYLAVLALTNFFFHPDAIPSIRQRSNNSRLKLNIFLLFYFAELSSSAMTLLFSKKNTEGMI